MGTPQKFGEYPKDVLFLIHDELPEDAKLALRLTCKELHESLKVKICTPKGQLSECAKRAIRDHLKLPSDDRSLMRCRGCKDIYDESLFKLSKRPPLPHQPPSKDSERVLHVPPRWCNWHIRRIIKTSNEGRESEIKWTSRIKELCFHCNTIKEWHGCKCTCDSCGTERVRVYQRVTSDGSECKKYYFWRDRSRVSEDPTEQAHAPGRLFVREMYDSGDVDYQVEYEDMKEPGS